MKRGNATQRFPQLTMSSSMLLAFPLQPLRILGDAEVVIKLWMGEDSLVRRLMAAMEKAGTPSIEMEYVRGIEDGFPTLKTTNISDMDDPVKASNARHEVKIALLALRNSLMKLHKGCKSVCRFSRDRNVAAADLLLFYAHTDNFVEASSYSSFSSSPVTVYARELGGRTPRANLSSAKATEGIELRKEAMCKPCNPKPAALNTQPYGEVSCGSETDKDEICGADEAVAQYTKTYHGGYVLSQLLSWHKGGLGVEEKLPWEEMTGCLSLPTFDRIYDIPPHITDERVQEYLDAQRVYREECKQWETDKAKHEEAEVERKADWERERKRRKKQDAKKRNNTSPFFTPPPPLPAPTPVRAGGEYANGSARPGGGVVETRTVDVGVLGGTAPAAAPPMAPPPVPHQVIDDFFVSVPRTVQPSYPHHQVVDDVFVSLPRTVQPAALNRAPVPPAHPLNVSVLERAVHPAKPAVATSSAIQQAWDRGQAQVLSGFQGSAAQSYHQQPPPVFVQAMPAFLPGPPPKAAHAPAPRPAPSAPVVTEVKPAAPSFEPLAKFEPRPFSRAPPQKAKVLLGESCLDAYVYDWKKRQVLLEWGAKEHRNQAWREPLTSVLGAADEKCLIGSPVLDFLLSGDDSNIDSALYYVKKGKTRSGGDDKKQKSDTQALLDSTLSEAQPGTKNFSWVQCDNPKCMKWRKLPWYVDLETLPDKFVCADNKWEPAKASCEAEEDEFDVTLEKTVDDEPLVKFDDLKVGMQYDVIYEENVKQYRVAEVIAVEEDGMVLVFFCNMQPETREDRMTGMVRRWIDASR